MNYLQLDKRNFFENKEFNNNFNFSSQIDLSLLKSKNEIINNDIPNYKIIGILNSEFYLIQKIGYGASYSIYLSYSIHDEKIQKTFYAIKIININELNENIINNCKVNILEKINHKNIVKVYGHGLGKLQYNNGHIQQVYYSIMDYLNHGTLLSQIDGNKGFGEDFGRLIFTQLLDGLEAFHNSNIVLREIKFQNIMLSGDNYILKYVDFSLTKEKSNEFLNNYLGTYNYIEPELLLKKPYLGFYKDIFSLGVILFIIVTGELPFFQSLPNDPLYHYIIDIDYISYWRKRKINVSPSFMELFDNLVAFEPSQRPSISEIRCSKWMKEINWELFPSLIEEFMNREKKYKQNKEYKKEKAIEISLENKVQINKNIYSENNSVNDIDQFLMKIKGKEKEIENEIKKQLFPMNNLIKEDENINTRDDTISKNNVMQDYINFKLEIKTMHPLMNLLKKFLSKQNYNILNNDFDNLIMEISNDELDINLKFEKMNKDIKISFTVINGNEQDFINFKKLIIQFIYDISKEYLNENNLYNENSQIYNNNNNNKIAKKDVIQGFINFKLKNKSIPFLMVLLKKYLKKFGYVTIKKDLNNLKMKLSNGEIDINLKFIKMNKDIKISFYIKNGTEQEFINFKILISLFVQKLK